MAKRMGIKYLMDDSAFGGCHYLLECTVPTGELGGGGIMVWGWFQGLGPLVPVMGNVSAKAYFVASVWNQLVCTEP